MRLEIFDQVDFILLPSLPRSNNLKEDCNMDTSPSYENCLKSEIDSEKEHDQNNNKKSLCVENGDMYNKYMREIFLIISSITGFPSIVIPSGEFTKNLNEPQSFQLLNSKLNEHELLKVALAYKDKMDVNKKLLHNLENKAS